MRPATSPTSCGKTSRCIGLSFAVRLAVFPYGARWSECEDGWRASYAYPQRIYLPEHGEIDDAPVEPGQLVAALAGYGVPVELIDCDLTDGDAVVSALGMRAAAR
jgi:hypothetical protein